MTRLSKNLAVMSRSYKGHRFILVVINEVNKFIVTISIHQSRSEDIGDTLREHVFSMYGIEEYIIMDQDGAFISTLINYLFRKLGI